jgi:hypothetical protein
MEMKRREGPNLETSQWRNEEKQGQKKQLGVFGIAFENYLKNN